MNRLLAAFMLATLPVLAAEPQLRPWTDYRTIMWIGDSASKKPEKLPLFFQRLREMGINTGMLYGDGNLQPLLENNFPYYVENIVNRGLCLKFNSKVTDWDRFVSDWTKNGRPESALVRDYCLNDEQWLESSRDLMRKAARKNAPHTPLAYDIRDELSTTMSANPFDYDFSPIALDAFRAWLKKEYASLEALNAEWQTKFASWTEVKPFTTDQIKNRMSSGEALPRGNPDWQAVQALKFDSQNALSQPTRWNFAPWADFRSFMDASLANALDQMRRAAHEVDPATPVGIEGTQMPDAFGGYDLWRLGQALDWVEPYDIGNARDIFGSFMPGKAFLTTVFENDTDHASRRLWHLLLQGDRACLIWWSEDCIDWSSPDYALTAKAKALRPVLKQMTSPLAKLLLNAKRERDPIAIHYSQASIQADWLLESTVDGSTWLRRFSSFEADHNQFAKLRGAIVKAIEDAGYRPEFVSTEQIERGELRARGFKALVMPDSLAISDKELEAISGLYASGGKVIGTQNTAVFDGHCKLRTKLEAPWLPRGATGNFVFASAKSREPSIKAGDITQYGRQRLAARSSAEWAQWFQAELSDVPRLAEVPSEDRVLVHRLRSQNWPIIALERNISYQMSEDLKQAGGNEQLEKPLKTELRLADAAHIYDLWSGQYLGHLKTANVTIDPWRPTLLVVLPEQLASTKPIEELAASLK